MIVPYRMDTFHLASPACAERGCSISLRDETPGSVVVFQHGDNPDAVVRLRASYCVPADEVTRSAFRQLADLAERCHREEDGLPPDR